VPQRQLCDACTLVEHQATANNGKNRKHRENANLHTGILQQLDFPHRELPLLHIRDIPLSEQYTPHNAYEFNTFPTLGFSEPPKLN